MKNTKNTLKRIASILLALLLCIGVVQMIGAGAFAEMSASGINGSKKTSPEHLDETTSETTVTLQLPAVAESGEYDIVFVMDSSSSTRAGSDLFANEARGLLSAIVSTGVTVNVGVVKYRGIAYDTIDLVTGGANSGLVSYDASTSAAIEDAITYPEASLKLLSSGSNIHGALVMADEWLSADTTVADNHKYVILVSDGKSYIWYNSTGEATTFYAQHLDKNLNNVSSFTGLPEIGQTTGSLNKDTTGLVNGLNTETGTNGFAFPLDAYANTWDAYAALYAYNSDPAILAELSGDSAYDARCLYAYKEDDATLNGTLTRYPINNRGTIRAALGEYYSFTPDSGFPETVKYMELNPYEVIDNGDSTYSYDYSSPNPDFYWIHPDSLQKGLYLAGHKWTEIGTKYNTAFIGFDGADHSKLNGGGYGIARSFFAWIQQDTISDYACNIMDTTALATLFDSIENDINYLIKSGTVTDKITDDFTLMQKGTDTFVVKLDDVVVSAAADGENKWVYGVEDGGVYPYVVEYDESANSFVWTINVPIENSKPVSLSYNLEVVEGAVSGDYDTNVSAELEYESFNGNTGTYTFEVPQVDYTYSPITDFTLKKTYTGMAGYDNAGNVVTTAGTLTEDVSFTVAPYLSFNREVGKTDIPAFNPGTYTIPVGSGTDEVTIDLPDYSTSGVGDYWYEVTETEGTAAGVTYDNATYYLHVTVIHRGASDTIGQVQLHTTAPNADGTYVNDADNKTDTLSNEYGAGSLTVKKTVTGNMADKNKPFDVVVTFTAPAGKTVTGDISYGVEVIAGGWTGTQSVTLSLTDGDSVTFENIPDGVTYTVAEADYSDDGYDVPEYAFDNASETGDTVSTGSEWTDAQASGTVSDSADTVTVTNNKTAEIDVGVILENAPFAILFVLAAGAVAAVIFTRKRRED